MDIKNILNDGERYHAASPRPAPEDAYPHPPENPAVDNVAKHPSISAAHPNSLRAEASLYPHEASYAVPPDSHPMPLPRMHAPPPLAQQIVYTGPVYQLQPAVEVRHMGNAIHYRYTQYPPYEELAHVDYAVYQEYEEVPRAHNTAGPIRSRVDRLSTHSIRPPQNSPLLTRDVPELSRTNRDCQYGVEQAEFEVSRLQDRSHEHRLEDGHRTSGHIGRLGLGPESQRGLYNSPLGAQAAKESVYSQRSQRCARLSHHPLEFARAYSPIVRSYRRSATGPSVVQPAAAEAEICSAKPRMLQERPGPDPHLPYVSYRGPTVPAVHTYSRIPQREFRACSAAYKSIDNGDGAPFPSSLPKRRSRNFNHDNFLGSEDVLSERVSRAHLEPELSGDSQIIPRMMKGHRSLKRERASRGRSAYKNSSASSWCDAEPGANMHDKVAVSNRDALFAASQNRVATPLADDSVVESTTGFRNGDNEYVSGARTVIEPETIGKSKRMRSNWLHRDGSGARSTSERIKRAKVDRSFFRTLKSSSRKKDGSLISNGDGCDSIDETRNDKVTEVAETSSCYGSEVIEVSNESDADSERDAPLSSVEDSSDDNVECSQPAVEPAGEHLEAAIDPEEPYPETTGMSSGLPPTAVGDLLQLWEFVTAFSKTLRLTPFTLRHLEQAIVYMEPSPLIDACLARLVRIICADSGLVEELGIAEYVVKSVTGKGSKNLATVVLSSLPSILSFESDDRDDDFLHRTVQKLVRSSDKWAFHRVIHPAGKLRVLRELVYYATMTDSLRECIANTLDHADEERKKAKEENSASRRKAEEELRQLKAELLEYRLKNGLEAPTGEEKEKRGREGKEGTRKGGTGANIKKEEVLSRKDKLLAARKERKEEEDRRVKERYADAIVTKIERLRTFLKTLKNIRLRNRSNHTTKAGDFANAMLSVPLMPFSAPHEDPVRTRPLGMDREERCYWFFEGSGRLWIEDTKTMEWCTLNAPESIEALVKWLSASRTTERRLRKRIKERKLSIFAEMSNEAKRVEAEENEADLIQESAAGAEHRITRAGKRKAELVKAQKDVKVKKLKRAATFLDYRNVEK